jgi:hypothetical protein
MGIVWMFSGFSDFFSWKNQGEYAYTFAHLAQLAVGAAILILIVFFHTRILNRKALWLLFAPLMSLSIIFTWSVLIFGLRVDVDTFFSHPYQLTNFSELLYSITVVPALCVAGIMLLRGMFDKRIPRIERKFVLLASISIIMLAISGSLEEVNLVSGIMVPMTRLLALISAMVAYIASTTIIEVKGRRRELVI